MGLKGFPIKFASEPQPAFCPVRFPSPLFCPVRFYRNPARRRLAIANFVSTGTPPAVD